MNRIFPFLCALALGSTLLAQLPAEKQLADRLAAGEGEAVLKTVQEGVRDPKLRFAHLRLGMEAAISIGELRDARRLADLAQDRFANDPEVYTWYGHVYMAQVEAARREGRPGLFARATLSDAATYYRQAREKGGDVYLNASCEAEALGMMERWDDAVKVIDLAIAEKSGDRRALLFKARLCRSAGRTADALAILHPLSTAHPKDVEVARELLSASLEQGDPEANRGLFLRLVERFPDDRPLYISFWVRYFQKPAEEKSGDAAYLQNAGTSANGFLRRCFEELVKSAPNNALARWYLGYLDETQSRLESSLAHYRRYKELTPGNAFAHLGVGRLLAKLGRLEASRRELFSANASGGIAPEMLADEMSRLVKACWDSKTWAMAIEVQRVVLSLRTTAKERLNLAALQYNSGRQKEGIRSYRDILSDPELSNADRATCENFLGLGLWGIGEKEEAVAALKRALEADSEQLDARENLGVFLFAMEKPAEAKEAFLGVLKRDPRRARSRYHLLRIEFGALL